MERERKRRGDEQSDKKKADTQREMNEEWKTCNVLKEQKALG